MLQSDKLFLSDPPFVAGPGRACEVGSSQGVLADLLHSDTDSAAAAAAPTGDWNFQQSSAKFKDLLKDTVSVFVDREARVCSLSPLCQISNPCDTTGFKVD